MSEVAEKTPIDTEETVSQSSKSFDHTVEHSDDFYEQYIRDFVPNSKKRTAL